MGAGRRGSSLRDRAAALRLGKDRVATYGPAMSGTPKPPVPPAPASRISGKASAQGAGNSAGETSPTLAPSAAARKGCASGTTPEIGGPSGPEPTRYGDWERKGRCIDF